MVESVVMKERFRDITPDNIQFGGMSRADVEEAVNIAFQIIGYVPNDMWKCIDKAWNESEADELCEFIYDVWRFDG